MIEPFKKYLQTPHYPNFDLHAVLFDMDGVLYDSMPAHARSWQQTMEEFGFKTTKPEEFFLHEGRTGKSTINIIFQREFGRNATDEEIKKIYSRKTELFSQYNSGKTITGAREVLEMVKSKGLLPFLVTGSGQPSLLEKLDEDYPGVFTPDTMVTAFDVKFGKPHPEPFLIGLKKAGNLQPNQAIVIENAPLGTEAAHKAGIFVIAVNTGPLPNSVLKKAGADLILDSMIMLKEKLPDIFFITQSIYNEVNVI
ncbi:HAD family hydrolase [Anaerorudis cellulosivorans]|uniref:HAD family hydrolase n=1 Tax=Anaerorudis cellulosivorans TaxID=3397862 RepID=UPI0022205410|nr:HAD-IA family hydrolase [Seramator thermalis]MCW1736186.1 HAD-IA family hydrolase [Seramator thermalis]